MPSQLSENPVFSLMRRKTRHIER